MWTIDLTSLNRRQLQQLLEVGRRNGHADIIEEVTREMGRRDRGDAAPSPMEPVGPDAPGIAEQPVEPAPELDHEPPIHQIANLIVSPPRIEPCGSEVAPEAGYWGSGLALDWAAAITHEASSGGARANLGLGLIAATLAALAFGIALGSVSASILQGASVRQLMSDPLALLVRPNLPGPSPEPPPPTPSVSSPHAS